MLFLSIIKFFRSFLLTKLHQTKVVSQNCFKVSSNTILCISEFTKWMLNLDLDETVPVTAADSLETKIASSVFWRIARIYWVSNFFLFFKKSRSKYFETLKIIFFAPKLKFWSIDSFSCRGTFSEEMNSHFAFSQQTKKRVR